VEDGTMAAADVVLSEEDYSQDLNMMAGLMMQRSVALLG
jgi:hypothetical protein